MSTLGAYSDRLPDKLDADVADQLRQILASEMVPGEHVQFPYRTSEGERGKIILTPSVAETLLDILRLIGSRSGFRVVPYSAELTTQEAADLLNVSRPYLIKLLESDEIPFHKIGRHRRVLAEDLFKYKRRRDIQRSEALSELAEMDAKLLFE